MGLELNYNVRYLLTRKTTTLMTLGGIALVVFVYVASLMLDHGLNETLAGTGSAENAIILRTGAQNEIQSGVTREHAGVILAEPEVERLPDGSPRATTDTLVLVSLKKRRDNQPSNVNLRGVSPVVMQVRDGIKLIAGRLPAVGTKELMVGSAINRKFANTDIGQTVRLVGTDWEVVGIFDAGGSGFSSEVWGDVDILMPSFRREQFSSLTFRIKPGSDFVALRERLENDRRLSVAVKKESEFYASQSKSLGMFIRFIGTFVSVVFSIGAVVGAMITMYSAVANRTREIGIMRALGFSSSAIFAAFVKECLLIGLIGGVLGVICAALMNFVGISTTNFDTFSEVAFGFSMTPGIVLKGLVFSLVMGFLGGALPAFRASRIRILEALRAE